jgi:aldehyde dehydrogenase (NAD+)
MVNTWDYEFDTPLYKGKVSVKTGLFINNEWVDASGNDTIECVVYLL